MAIAPSGNATSVIIIALVFFATTSQAFLCTAGAELAASISGSSLTIFRKINRAYSTPSSLRRSFLSSLSALSDGSSSLRPSRAGQTRSCSSSFQFNNPTTRKTKRFSAGSRICARFLSSSIDSSSTAMSSGSSDTSGGQGQRQAAAGEGSLLSHLRFDNRNVIALPVDPNTDSAGNLMRTSRQVKNAIFALIEPTPVEGPEVVAVSPAALRLVCMRRADDSTLGGSVYSNEETGSELLVPITEREVARYLGGCDILPGSRPAAHCYCGHQFGSFAGQLGDGATMYLGEVITPAAGRGVSRKPGEGGGLVTAPGADINTGTDGAGDCERWELQLKGAGRTPFSRTADGRKVFRSSVREFLCSEAMHHLGVPTTRSASCVTSAATTVLRDPLYNGNLVDEKCTIISRIAPNFFRFGSFEIFKQQGAEQQDRNGPSAGNLALKKQLLDHIMLYFPQYGAAASPRPSKGGAETTKKGGIVQVAEAERESYLLMFAEVARRTAKLVAAWQAVGFVHGVLNTDNMSVMGLTIDYGPFGFMEHFDPDFVPNGSDGSARYSYQKQPEICRWNLVKFAEALQPFLPDTSKLYPSSNTDNDPSAFSGRLFPSFADSTDPLVQRCLQTQYDLTYKQEYNRLFNAKFGFLYDGSDSKRSMDAPNSAEIAGEYAEFVAEFFRVMEATSADYTDVFVALTEFREARQTTTTTKTSSEEFGVQKLVDSLVSRSSSPQNMVDALRRKLQIHSKLGMHPSQTEQLWAMLQNEPEKVSFMFGGAPIDAIREQIGEEKRKLDLIVRFSQEKKRYEAMDAAQKKANDRAAWENWVKKYQKMLQTDKTLYQNGSEETAAAGWEQTGVALMRKNNPTFVLRNWIAQDAIDQHEHQTVADPEKAEIMEIENEKKEKMRKLDANSIESVEMAEEKSADLDTSYGERKYSRINTVLRMLCDPYNPAFSTFRGISENSGKGFNSMVSAPSSSSNPDLRSEEEIERYTVTPPEWADSLICTCSS